MFTVTLMGLPDLSPELVEDVEIRYRDMLVLVLGDDAEVVAACTTHDEVVARYPEELLPLGKTEAEQTAVKRWWEADSRRRDGGARHVACPSARCVL